MKYCELSGTSLVFSIPQGEEYNDYKTILSNLTDNGYGTYDENKFVIPKEYIYQFSGGQRSLLDLPREYPFYLKIDTNGQLINQPDFQYVPLFFETKSQQGVLRRKQVQNLPLIELVSANGEVLEFLLTEPQYMVLNEIDILNSKTFVDSSHNYYCLAQIKELAKSDSHIIFSETLANINVLAMSQVQLHINCEDDKLIVEPDITDKQCENNHIAKGDFSKQFHQRNSVIPVYTLPSQKGDVRHKIVIPENSTQLLTEIKKTFSSVSDPDQIREIIDNPQYFFDEELFDLSEFYSDRVIEIGLYKPKFYAFICPYKSEWIPGFIIEDKYNGNTNVILKDETDIAEFENSIKLATDNQSTEIDYKGYRLNIDDARNILAIAKKQNTNPKKKVELDNNGKKVLIIEENAESLGYKVENLNVDAPNFYEFHRINTLNNGINLKRHQQEGVAWLQYLVSVKDKGCLLADDMGLGKTLQVLYFIQWYNQKHNNNHRPFLIVAPVSLLDNWEKEITKFFKPNTFEPIIIHGDDVRKEYNEEEIEWLNRQNIILTNYETVRRGQFNICAVDYAVVVLDEAQKIKTPGTYITCASKALKADFKIAMTGTPVENTFLDLWCIMDFVIPGLLGNAKEFANHYQLPLKQPDTDMVSLGQNLRDKMGVFFMRRCKKEVLRDLPQKSIIVRTIEMSPYQEKEYIKTIKSTQNTQKESTSTTMLEIIFTLGEISESPYTAEKTADIESISINNLIDSSAKIQATLGILEEIISLQEKVIIFCTYKKSQRILQRIISDRFEINPKIINGDTKVISSSRIRNLNTNYSRQQAIDMFEKQDGFNVIIMSPIAAGMGLNVTAANHVIHFGRHWNPAKESQATDRAYRIGQTKPVYVYYPITTLSNTYNFKSFDQTLDDLLKMKMNLADATLFPTEQIEVHSEDFLEMIEKSVV